MKNAKNGKKDFAKKGGKKTVLLPCRQKEAYRKKEYAEKTPVRIRAR